MSDGLDVSIALLDAKDYVLASKKLRVLFRTDDTIHFRPLLFEAENPMEVRRAVYQVEGKTIGDAYSEPISLKTGETLTLEILRIKVSEEHSG